jgi:hypothetical protein
MSQGFDQKYPQGRISGEDEGQAPMAIAHDPDNNVVIIRFGVPTKWIGLSPAEVFNLLTLFAKHYSKMIGKVVAVTIDDESLPPTQEEPK